MRLKQDDRCESIRKGVNQQVKVRQHTNNYKVESRNLLRKFREEKRMITSNWGGGQGIKEGFLGKVTLGLALSGILIKGEAF